VLQNRRLRLLAVLAVGAVMCALVGLAACGQTPSAGAVSTNRKSHPGDNVLDGIDNFDYSSIREIDLEGLKKILQRDPKDTRPLLINFWATWCDGCREEFPDLVKIDNDYRDKVNFVSISLDEVTDI